MSGVSVAHVGVRVRCLQWTKSRLDEEREGERERGEKREREREEKRGKEERKKGEKEGSLFFLNDIEYIL